MSYYSCLPSLARKLLSVNLKIKCKKCGNCSKYKVQVPTCNPEAIASLTAPFTPSATPTTQNLIFTNITVNESCYNPCNTCYRNPCCCSKKKCDSSSSSDCSSSSSSSSSDETCHRKKKKKCHKKKKCCKSMASFAPSNCCPPMYQGNGCCPPSYGNGCPTPIAPSYCGGTPYFGLYNQTNGVFTIPPCGSGMYLFTATINVLGINAGTVTLNLMVNGALTQAVNMIADGTYYLVYRASLQESGTVAFNVEQNGNVTPSAVTITSGEVIATKLY